MFLLHLHDFESGLEVIKLFLAEFQLLIKTEIPTNK